MKRDSTSEQFCVGDATLIPVFSDITLMHAATRACGRQLLLPLLPKRTYACMPCIPVFTQLAAATSFYCTPILEWNDLLFLSQHFACLVRPCTRRMEEFIRRLLRMHGCSCCAALTLSMHTCRASMPCLMTSMIQEQDSCIQHVPAHLRHMPASFFSAPSPLPSD